ncbi:MAG: c-type cytochrome [Bdellovibrionales bacterium]|nr:c-type cytochrome [Bdellovibrionales bacterium]
MKILALLFFTFLDFNVHAQALRGCAKNKASDKCGQCDTQLKNEVLDLVSNLNEKKVGDVESFLDALPDNMKKDFVMMSESRSFQTSDTLNPRVLLRSPNSDIVLSFNSHQKHAEKKEYRGNDRVEMMVWDGANARFDFIDVQFPSESKGGKKGEKPIVTKNPQTCLNCHGGSNPRPNWDPYNFWSGQIPFNRDTLVRNSQETKDYLEILKRIEGTSSVKNPRLAKLKPLASANDVENALKEDERFQLPSLSSTASSNGDGPGVKLFDQLSQKNFCKIGNELNEHELKDKIKYAIQGLKNGCNLNNFFPKETQDVFKTYFEKRKIGVESSGKFSIGKLTQDTRTKQTSVFEDKKTRQLWAFEKEYELRKKELSKDKDFDARKFAMEQMKFMETYRPLENRESFSNASKIANLRYFLEPLGINVDSWSMSVDSGTYSFADVLGGLDSFGIFNSSELSGKGCEELQNLSQESFSNFDTEDFVKRACDEKFVVTPFDDQTAADLSGPAVEILREKVSTIFNSNACIACHDNGVNGAPKINYSNLKQLEKEMASTKKDANGGLAKVIWGRINRAEGAKGQMPMGMPVLSAEDQAVVRQYLNAITLKKD